MDRKKNTKRNQKCLEKQEILKTTEEKRNKNDSGHGGSEVAYSETLSPVQAMTSRDFHFDNNAHIDMINETLKDAIRIETFKAAILHNKHLFKGKCVLNVGCGTGIYALFAAKAGAAKVYAIDNSNVIYYTKQIVEANGYTDTIEVIKGNIKKVELPVKEVDIIISDWMGYALLFQSTCDNVIFARDKWLKKPGGLIFPDVGKIYVMALEDSRHKNGNIDWWADVYGFNMSCLRTAAVTEPRYQSVRPEQVISKPFQIKTVDLNTATLEDLNFRSKFMMPIVISGTMDGIALYFNVFFTKTHTPLGLTTDPWSARTNWLQTILFFDQPLSVNSGSLYYGGIEFTSPSKPINLNNIFVNFEMLMGDPTQADVDLQMTWHFKLLTAAAAEAAEKKVTVSPNKKTEENENILETNKNVEEKIFNKTETKVIKDNKPFTKKSAINNNVISCTGLVVTTDNTTKKTIIDKSPKNKKSKNKSPRKGLKKE